MTGRIALISNSRQVKELHQTVKRLQPMVIEVVDAGCGIAPFFKGYAERVLKHTATNNPVLEMSSFTWEKGSRKRVGIDAFSIVSRNPDYEGTYLSVKRVVKEDLEWNKHHSLGYTREFHAHIAERLKYSTLFSKTTSAVLGDTVKTLIGMGKFLISFKVDNGIHLVFKEALRSNRCLEIYIGGWFDEVRHPLEAYQNTKLVNPLRQPADLIKGMNHGSNRCATTSLRSHA